MARSRLPCWANSKPAKKSSDGTRSTASSVVPPWAPLPRTEPRAPVRNARLPRLPRQGRRARAGPLRLPGLRPVHGIDLLAGGPVLRQRPTFRDRVVLGFVDKYGSAATREVAEVFEVADDAADEALQRLTAAGLLECVSAETGRLYRAVGGEGFCDATTGVCGWPPEKRGLVPATALSRSQAAASGPSAAGLLHVKSHYPRYALAPARVLRLKHRSTEHHCSGEDDLSASRRRRVPCCGRGVPARF